MVTVSKILVQMNKTKLEETLTARVKITQIIDSL